MNYLNISYRYIIYTFLYRYFVQKHPMLYKINNRLFTFFNIYIYESGGEKKCSLMNNLFRKEKKSSINLHFFRALCLHSVARIQLLHILEGIIELFLFHSSNSLLLLLLLMLFMLLFVLLFILSLTCN